MHYSADVRSSTRRAAARRHGGLLVAVVLLALRATAFAGVNMWTSQGPGGSLTAHIAVDPTSPATLYTATDGRGVFKSTNGGSSWTAINTGLTNLSIRRVAINPQTPTTLYAGASTGVFKSTNGGASWSPASTGLPTITAVFDLVINPQSPATLYVAVGQGSSTSAPAVFRSTNGGGSWSEIDVGFNPNRSIGALAIDPQTPTTIYAADFEGAIFKSTNSGSFWFAVLPGSVEHIYDIAVDPQTPTRVYAAAGRPGQSGGIYKSVDGGTSWTLTTIGASSNAVFLVTVDPSAPFNVYAATDDGIYRSTDRGGLWSPINNGLMDFDVLALRVDPQTPTTVYAATYYGGIVKSTTSGASWFTAATGLPGADVAAVAVDPQSSTTIYAATFGDGVQKSSDRGASWSSINVGLPPNTSMTALAIDPQTPARLYAGTPGGVFRSLNGGATWSASGIGTSSIRSLAVNPQTPATVYAGTVLDGLFKSTNAGGSWSDANNGLSMFFVRSIVLDPATPTTVYVGGDNVFFGAGVYRSTDAGGSWSPLNVGLTNLFVNAVAVDPQNPATLYAGTQDGVFKLANGSLPWVPMNTGLSNLNVTSLAVDPLAPTSLYAGTAGGVFKSTNAGGTWSALNAGLTQLSVVSVALDPQIPTIVFAGVSGNGGGVFDLEQPQCGNGFIEAPEQCDQGAANGGVSCCTAFCQRRPSGTTCRLAGGECDLPETCDGSSDACPQDDVKTNGTACSTDNNACTLDVCDGSGVGCTHPAGNGGMVCRPAAGECDLPENCTGISPTCPNDQFNTSGACTSDGNPCTLDVCNGSGAACAHPAGNAGTVCRPVGGECDIQDVCDGTSPTCPDATKPSGTSCTADADVCTSDQCNGTNAVCQHTSVAGCVPSASTQATVGGPTNLCTGGIPVPGGCQLSTPNATLTIPDGALPTAQNINIVGHSNSSCPTFSGVQGPNGHVATCVELLPNGFANFAVPVDLTLRWTPCPNGCDVNWSGGCTGLLEGPTQAFVNGVAVSDRCDLNKVCPTPTAPGDIGHTCIDSSLCDTAICNPLQNTWTITGLQHFSEYSVGSTPCGGIADARLTLSKIAAPPGDDKLSFKGVFTLDNYLAYVDPDFWGVDIVLSDEPDIAQHIALPPGAYDPVTHIGWKQSGGTNPKFLYSNKSASPPGGITKLVLQGKGIVSPALVKVQIKGKNGTFAASPNVRATLYLGGSGNNQCFEAAFPGPPPAPTCTLNRTGSALKCK